MVGPGCLGPRGGQPAIKAEASYFYANSEMSTRTIIGPLKLFLYNKAAALARSILIVPAHAENLKTLQHSLVCLRLRSNEPNEASPVSASHLSSCRPEKMHNAPIKYSSAALAAASPCFAKLHPQPSRSHVTSASRSSIASRSRRPEIS